MDPLIGSALIGGGIDVLGGIAGGIGSLLGGNSRRKRLEELIRQYRQPVANDPSHMIDPAQVAFKMRRQQLPRLNQLAGQMRAGGQDMGNIRGALARQSLDTEAGAYENALTEDTRLRAERQQRREDERRQMLQQLQLMYAGG